MSEHGEFLQILKTRVGNARVLQVEASDPIAMHLREPGKRRIIEFPIVKGDVGPFGLSDCPQKPRLEHMNTRYASENLDVIRESPPRCGERSGFTGDLVEQVVDAYDRGAKGFDLCPIKPNENVDSESKGEEGEQCP